MTRLVKVFSLLLFLVVSPLSSVYGQNYRDALQKSLLYFEAQRSGPLPRNQRVQWRGNSALNDGKDAGVNLVGGYYDSGDNVKFGFPMAFTITMLSWGIIEYGRQLQATAELNNALAAVRWGTDYFIKAHTSPNVLYAQVGEPSADHQCWERPEDMTTSRRTYKIDEAHAGSDLAGETAAAMAAASIVFASHDPAYAKQLRGHAFQLFNFAVKFPEKYSRSVAGARDFYNSYGYSDELLWAAAWCYKASGSPNYLSYLANNGESLGGTTTSMNFFNWDNKYVGVQTLVAMILNEGKAGKYTSSFEQYRAKAEEFMCNMVGQGANNVPKTPAFLVHIQEANNLQFATSAALVATIYADHITATKRELMCSKGLTPTFYLHDFGKAQVNYILGSNPRNMSYMVGYSKNFPRHIHHRGASIVSIKKDPKLVGCSDGYNRFYDSGANDPNVLSGAVVGGPDINDHYEDSRKNYNHAEPSTYTTAPLVGLLAKLSVR